MGLPPSASGSADKAVLKEIASLLLTSKYADVFAP
jgi:hypothetical protein